MSNDLPYPPLQEGKPFVVLSDYDGTISMRDSNDFLTDNYGFGIEKRRQMNLDVLHDKICFRDSFKQMLDSVTLSFAECSRVLCENITLDPGFKAFHAYCKERDIPVIIVSSGMAPLIRAMLGVLIGEEDARLIEIIANDVRFTDAAGTGETWEIVFRNPDSRAYPIIRPFGHDKSKSILPYTALNPRPTTFFMGDGVSDLSAARHSDCLFVKDKGGENDLKAYCHTERIPHRMFESFNEVLTDVKSVVDGGAKVESLLTI